VAAITPWNSPIASEAQKMAPALAAGNAVVVKPAEVTPLMALELAAICEEAGVPKGMISVLPGKGSVIGDAITKHPLVRRVSFTGGTNTGKHIAHIAADKMMPVSLELGGKSPTMVFEDADLDVAVEGAMITKFRNTGQSCIASNRIYVQRSIYDKFLEKFLRQTCALKTGDGFDEGVLVGPVINEEALAKALEHINDAVKRGARLLCGGKRMDRRGYFLEPTVLADVPAEAACMCEETFAPVAPVVPFDDESEAIMRANNSQYGLSAYAFTRDLSRAFRLMEQLEAGTIGINDGVPTTSQCPFGGIKQSGWGRELGSEGMDAFLETKHVSIGL